MCSYQESSLSTPLTSLTMYTTPSVLSLHHTTLLTMYTTPLSSLFTYYVLLSLLCTLPLSPLSSLTMCTTPLTMYTTPLSSLFTYYVSLSLLCTLPLSPLSSLTMYTTPLTMYTSPLSSLFTYYVPSPSSQWVRDPVRLDAGQHCVLPSRPSRPRPGSLPLPHGGRGSDETGYAHLLHEHRHSLT